MNTKKNIALLCDYGLDDALATLYLLKNSDGFDKIDILPIGGNFPMKKSFVNAKRLLTYAESNIDNVRIVDTKDVTHSEESIPEIHGNDGMGDVLPMEYKETATVISYEEWLLEVDDSYTIVSLGPCTVTLDILKRKGSLPLIIMGGNISEPPNYKGYEFNHGLDIESFAECVKYPHLAVTLDTCHIDPLNLNLLELPQDGLFGAMLNSYRELSRGRGEVVCSVYDMTAIIYVVHPDRFEVVEMCDKDNNRLSVLKYVSSEPIF